MKSDSKAIGEQMPVVSDDRLILLALRLGWTISEFLGRTRQYFALPDKDKKSNRDLCGFADYEAPRFTYSDGVRSSEGAWWQSAIRLAALAEALNLLDDRETSNKIRAFPDRVFKLTYPALVNPRPEADEALDISFSPRYCYEILEPWCRQVDLTLNTKDERASLAFTVGGEIADTFWFMRFQDPSSFASSGAASDTISVWGSARNWGKYDSWHQLLNHKRLNVIIDRLKVFESELPNSIGPILRFSLFRWSIAHGLTYRKKGLTLEYEWLWHTFHALPWLMTLRNRRIEVVLKRFGRPLEKESGMLENLEVKDEGKLYRKLRKQSQEWQRLILGEKLPQNYLKATDRFNVTWQSVAIYLILLTLIVHITAIIGYFLVLILGGWVTHMGNFIISGLTPTTTQPQALKDSFEIAKIIVPWLAGLTAFIGGVLRGVWQGAVGLYPRIRDWLVQRKIERNVWVSWREDNPKQRKS